MKQPALIVESLVKRYGAVEAVRGVSLEVGESQIFGLLGPNGAGKTSTLECIIGLQTPDGGAVRVCGIDALAEPHKVRPRIGVALQATALQDRITPREALRFFGAFYRRRAEAGALLARFALADKADAFFESLSAGQKQRLGLALALVNEPEVLFLDEPTSGLDPQSRRELHGAIRQIAGEGRTVFLTTHLLDEAHQLCDQVAVLDHGRVVAAGRPDDLIARAQARPRVSLRTAFPVELPRLRELAACTRAQADGASAELETDDVGRTVIALVHLLESLDNELLDLHVRKPSLEDVFLELTTRGG